MIATPIDNTQPVHAEGWLQGTIDKVHWFQVAKLIADGNGIQYDGGPMETLYAQMRFRLESTTNCKVDVFLANREG